MRIPNDTELLQHIEDFLERTGMKPTPFGIAAMGEGGLMKSLRDGRSLSLKSAQRVLDFMREHEAGMPDVPQSDIEPVEARA
jgi:hypothetical protein